MNLIHDVRFLPLRGLLLATLAALPAMALAEDTVEELTNPDTIQFSFGLAHVDSDTQRFGMYNGLEENQGYAIGSVNIIQRDDETGLWRRINARNLGLSTQEIGAEVEKQGAWRIAVDYNQIPRVSPYEIHTNLQGIGGNDLSYANLNNTPQAASTAPGSNLETNRYKTRLELSRSFSREIEFRLLFQNEHKQGERLFGRGTSTTFPSVAQEFLAEPINYLTRQLDMSLNYTGERLQLSGSYYGAFFSNDDEALNIAGGATNLRTGTPPFTPISLPPDNYSHQLSLLGAYQFTPTTQGKFKLSYTRAYQNDDFMSVGSNCAAFFGSTNCNISGRNDLGGKLNTTLVDLGLTSRPFPKLNLVAKLRYEDRDDNTTVAQYIDPKSALPASTNGFNEPRSLTVESGKLEASYQLPQGFTLIGGVDAERKDRTVEGVRVVGYRSRVEEMTYHVGLRRSLADTLMGAVSYERSDRTGSDFRRLRTWNTNNTSTTADDSFGGDYVLGGLMQPIYLADRDRHKIKLGLDWMPTDAISLQFNAEDSRDDYQNGRYEQAPIGAREGTAWQLNFDVTYALNDNWKFGAWASRDQTTMDQADCVNKTSFALCAANTWNSALTNRSDALGLSARGKIVSKLNVGADVTYMRDRNDYALSGKGTAATASDLPTITSYLTTLKLFANYPVGKESSVQLDYILDYRKTNDWTWQGYQYTDGTWLDQQANETAHFIGVSYRYGFR